MTPLARHVHTGERVRSALAVAMRADPDAVDLRFVQDARRLVLALAAAVADALAAYRVHSATLDRAEAWRRADAWFTHETGGTCPITVEEFDAGFIARTAAHDRVLLIDRHTGRPTLWPPMPSDTLADHYRRHQRDDR